MKSKKNNSSEANVPFYKFKDKKKRHYSSERNTSFRTEKNESIEYKKAERENIITEESKKADFPQCPHRKKCGGCQLQNLSYPEQLSMKMANEIKLLGKYCKVEEIIGMENPYHYRNKVQSAFYTDPRSRKIISGIYQSSTHKIVPVDDCMIEDKKADEIIVSVRKLLKDFKMTTYNEVTGHGFLRHVLVKRAFATNEIMVVLVTGTPVFPAKNNFCKALLKLHPEITTIIHNVNDKFTSLLLGKNEKVLYGPGFIIDECCGLKFRISAKSFYQINPVQTEKMYTTAIEYAGLKGGETVIDAYCGTGTIGLCAAGITKAKTGKNIKLTGIELNADAVKDAIQNQKLNNIDGVKFYTADATEFLSGMAAEGEKADVVFMDPPRAGSTEEFILSVCALAPKKIVYISCNPETLARDLKGFVDNGYKVKKVQPFDNFPMTLHTETVVLMSRA